MNLLGAQDMSVSQAPTAPPAVAVATATTTAAAVAAVATAATTAAAANLMHHCGGVDIHHHHGSTKYNKILYKISEKRKKTYLVGAQDMSCLEPPDTLVIPSLALPWWWCVHHCHHCSCTCSLIIKKLKR